jgi:DNA-binding NarL/FixJ family response regulator
VGAGENYLSDEAREGLLTPLRAHQPIPRLDLTLREVEILRLTAAGATSADIGEALHLSASTVKNHLRHLYEKLGVSTAAAAVHRAMREGVLQ